MSTQFAFRADSITTSLDNFASEDSSVSLISGPTVAPISDAINNVRFACAGFAGHGGFETAFFSLSTRHTFNFRPRATGRLTAHTHFMPQGGFSLVARASTWLFDRPGVVHFGVIARMRVRVLAANGTVPLSVRTPFLPLFGLSVRGGSVADAEEGIVDSELLEFSLTRSFETVVVPTDTIEVQARYTVQVFALDGAEFTLDFTSVPAAAGEPGDGLNSPFAVINISE
jgi:hypothetical protein